MPNWTTKVNNVTTVDAAHINDLQKHISWECPEYYGAVGDGVTDDTAALVACITAASGHSMCLSKNYRIGSSVAVPSTVSLYFSLGGMLSVDSGVTITVSGPVLAGPYKIFNLTGTGVVSFARGLTESIFPDWWTTNTTPGTTDMTTAIQAAIDSIVAAGSPTPNVGACVKILPQRYLFTSQLTINGGTAFENPIIIAGVKEAASVLYYTGTDDPAITSAGAANTHGRQIELRDLALVSDGVFSGVGVSIIGDTVNSTTPSMLTRLERILFRGWAGTALKINKAYGVTMRDVWFRSCPGLAFDISGPTPGDDFVNDLRLQNVSIELCTKTDYVATVGYTDGLSWDGGVVEASGSGVLVGYARGGCIKNLYLEQNGTNTPYLDLLDCGPLAIVGNLWSLGDGEVGYRTRFRSGGAQYFSQSLIGNTFFSTADGKPIELGSLERQAYPPILIGNYYGDATVPVTYTNVLGQDGTGATGNTPEILNGQYGLLDSLGAYLWKMDGAEKYKIFTLANDATPSVLGGRYFVTGGTTTITDFDDGATGQVITIRAEHSLILTHGTNIFMADGRNFEMISGDSIVFMQKDDTHWYEISRANRLIHSGGSDNLWAGDSAGNSNSTVGARSVGIGSLSQRLNNGGNDNVSIGYFSMGDGTVSGDFNTACGSQALSKVNSGGANTAVGALALANNVTSNNNVAIGASALTSTTGANHVAVGQMAGYSAGAVNAGVYLGCYAGFYETAGNALFIDNTTRASEADGRAKALVYGGFSSTTAAQWLTTNANFGVGTSTFGTSADFVVALKTGTAPSSSPADCSQMYSADYAAGDARMHIRGEAGYPMNLGNQELVGGDQANGNLTLRSTSNATKGYVYHDGRARDTGGSLHRRYYHLPLGSANPGASGATWVDGGTNTVGGWQLNAAGEVLRGGTDIHGDWDGASDMKMEVRFQVNVDNSGGAAGDTVDLKIVARYMGNTDTAVKTQTVEVPTTVGACAQYTMFTANFTLDYDAASNVIEAGDHLSVYLNLETDSSEVDDIIIVGMSFSYLTTHIGIEDGDE